MTRILHIQGSPRGANSQSNAMAQAYLNARRTKDPSADITELNLWNADLPHFDGDKAAAKMTFFGVGEMDATRQSAWGQIVDITNTFTAADEYVLSVPMWNGGIPYALKQYIDIITQPGLLFGFDPEAGYTGLLAGKSAKVFYTSGVYSSGAPAKYGVDHHAEYLNWWLNSIGVSDVSEVRFQPSLMTPTPDEDRNQALMAAAALA